MRIVHFSDWHWSFAKLPEADLYVCSGDMMPNFPRQDGWPSHRWRIDPAHERAKQMESAAALVEAGGFRRYLGSPDSPVVGVRGNHDFVDIKELFVGCNFVHEFVDNEVVELLGHKITGHRGIPAIVGNWNDEVQFPDLLDRARAMPPADIYVTHYPPHGLELDGENGVFYGLKEMLNVMIYKDVRTSNCDFDRPPSALHLFGHIHECGGRTRQAGDILFSQAATTYNVLDGSSRDGGWHDVSPL